MTCNKYKKAQQLDLNAENDAKIILLLYYFSMENSLIKNSVL